MKEFKEYIEMDGLSDATHLEVMIYYDKGGYNLSGQASRRGYYLSVSPVTKGNGCISITLFSGYKQLLMETRRYSDKQFDLAVANSSTYKQDLINKVVEKNKIA